MKLVLWLTPALLINSVTSVASAAALATSSSLVTSILIGTRWLDAASDEISRAEAQIFAAPRAVSAAISACAIAPLAPVMKTTEPLMVSVMRLILAGGGQQSGWNRPTSPARHRAMESRTAAAACRRVAGQRKAGHPDRIRRPRHGGVSRRHRRGRRLPTDRG